MEINLTWDLFVIVFFMVIIAYSFVIGRNQTMKVVLSSYVAILAADGVGNLLQQYFFGTDPVINVLTIQTDNTGFVLMKISIFVILTVLLTIRGAFHIELIQEKTRFLGVFLTAGYGVMSAGLIISTILVYISGASILELAPLSIANPIVEIAQQSALVRTMIENYSIWFSLPALMFMGSSLFGGQE